MAFDTTAIAEVFPPRIVGGQLMIEWSSSAPAGTYFQVYIQGELAWSGQGLHASVDIPHSGVNRIDVGAVGAAERDQDFSASLTIPNNRARLGWTAAGLDARAFRVYGESAAGGGISYASPLAVIAAGSTVGSYSWTSGPLTSGTWHYGIKSVDAAGNEGAAVETSVAISVPPRPPAIGVGGKRLAYTYSQLTGKITLNWLASPA